MTQTQQNPIVGITASPSVMMLSDYVLQASVETFRALSTYAIASDELVDIWVVSRAMEAVGWKNEVDSLAVFLEDEDMHYKKSEQTYLLTFDDGSAISAGGIVGLDDIRDHLEQRLRGSLMSSVERGREKGANETLDERLLKLPIQWRRGVDDEQMKRMSNQISRFDQHPRSQECIESVAAALAAYRLADVTPQASSAPSRLRL